MGFHLIGASEAAAGTGTVAIAFPLDNVYRRTDNNDAILLKPNMINLLGLLYSAESTGARCLLRQPEKLDKSFLKCCLTSDLDPSQGWHDHFKAPVKLEEDKLSVYSVNATDEDTIVGLMLGDQYLNTEPFTIDEIIDGYSDTTVTANTWTDCAVTWNQTLRKGRYSVVGMRGSVYLAANPWTALMRLDHPDWKIGVPATIAEADHEELQSQTNEPWCLFGNIGVEFNAPEEIPDIQVLSPAAHTDENVQLMLQRVG